MDGFQAIAARVINTTKNHLFLTGKAGTGKTTFLKKLSSFTHKNFIVVAPTGIAALNAGGVTIHSQFLFPPGTFLPGNALGFSETRNYFNQQILAAKHPLNAARKQVLSSIDLLVIDEVSMLRADLLDAIDYRMRSVRNNFRESFGGVQVLFIGDLYQLPPVVRGDEEKMLREYYPTPWFYEALALKQQPPILIELDKIYRQQDDGFIALLNNLRNNEVTESDIDKLNQYHLSPEKISELRDVITLTTHNYKADELNRKELAALTSRSAFFVATIENEFPESMYPVAERLELKSGAQIMFVRNDVDGIYFNGKLATVTDIVGSDVWVELAESKVRYKLKKERWENKKYTLDPNREMSEEVVGSFEQFPVKLAWAVTVHKSQGLTFEKAIIDVGDAFAEGQVYVALSRLRSLNGLVLRTRINPRTIRTDQNIIGFVNEHHRPDRLDDMIRRGQMEFVRHLLENTFDFESLIRDLKYIVRSYPEKEQVSALTAMISALSGETENTEKFRRQLAYLLETDQEKLRERLEKGCGYYRDFLLVHLRTIVYHQEELSRESRVKGYLNDFVTLDAAFSRKIKEIDKVNAVVNRILNGEEMLPFADDRFGADRKRIHDEVIAQMPAHGGAKKKKAKKNRKDPSEKSTYHITLDFFREGLSIAEIAAKRELTESTIETHLARAVDSGEVNIQKLLSNDAISEILQALGESEVSKVSGIYHQLGRKYTHGLIRAVIAHRNRSKVSNDSMAEEINKNL